MCDTPETLELGRKIAAAMGGDWKLDENNVSWLIVIESVSIPRAAILINANHKSKLEVSGRYYPLFFPADPVNIRMSKCKDPVAMAADIHRRFLGRYLADFHRMAAVKVGREADDRSMRGVMLELSALLGTKPPAEGSDRNYASGPVSGFCLSNDGVSVEATLCRMSVAAFKELVPLLSGVVAKHPMV